MTWISEVVSSILTPTITVGAFAYVFRKVFDRQIERDLEKFKSELEIRKFEHQTRYSHIHEKRAEVIATIYSKIARARRLMAQLTTPLQLVGESLQGKKQRAASAGDEVDDYFNENRLYLSASSAQKVEDILTKMKEAFFDFDTSQQKDGELRAETQGLWAKAYKSIREEVPPLLTDLEREFKEVLGLIDKEP